MLQEQYDALTKEITEKQLLMETQLAEKEKTSGTIEEEMSGKILSQEQDIQKQVILYQEQTLIKQNDERELIKVHGDYKKKYDEFA